MPLTINEIFAAFAEPPEKAIEFLRSKGLQTSWSADELSDMHTQAFTLAKVLQLDVLQDVQDELERALNGGKTFHEFKKNLQERLIAKGWWGKREVVNPETGETATVELGSPWRLRTIFQTNLQTAYMAGRYLGMLETTETRPFWQNRSIVDNQTTQQCADLDGKVYRYDDPIWAYIYPPGHYRCRRRVVSLGERYIEKKKLTVETAANYPKEKFGNSPGFDRHPAKQWSPNLSKYSTEFVEKYKEVLKKVNK